MEPLAIERRYGLVRIGDLLAPKPGRLAFAARLAFLCAITVLVAETYTTLDVALTAYVVFFLNKPDRMSSLILPVVMTIVITVLIGLVFLMAQVVLDDPGLRVLSMALVSFGFMFLVSSSKLRPLGQIFALIVAYALDLLGSVPGELATRGLLFVWLCVGIPAGVSILFNLLGATPPRRLVQATLARRLRLAARLLRAEDSQACRELAEALREANGEIDEWLGRAAVEKSSPPGDIGALRQAARASIALLLTLDFVERTPDAVLPEPLAQALGRTLEDMAAILEQGGYPLGVTVPQPPPLPPLAQAAYGEIADCLERFAEKPDAEPPAPKKTGFFLADAFTNPQHVRYALKATTAAMICYFTYSLLDWPSIHTCLITCYIVSFSTVAESVEKLVLRIAGCLIGAALGLFVLIFVIPFYDSVMPLLATIFLGTFAAAWVAAGSPRIAYVGLQFAFAFFLCVLQGSGPAFDMVVARDRVIGILFGNLVVYLVFTQVWPVSLKDHIEGGVTNLLRRLTVLKRATDRSSRRAAAVQLLAARAAVEDDLDVVRYEPAEIRPPAGWLSLRRELLDRTAALQAPLVLIGEQPALRNVVSGQVAEVERVLARMGEAHATL
ncbi:MAG TPA: FUSC family protein [Rhizomicrobium sp.]|jgi:multidrug resistance protein MdtO